MVNRRWIDSQLTAIETYEHILASQNLLHQIDVSLWLATDAIDLSVVALQESMKSLDRTRQMLEEFAVPRGGEAAAPTDPGRP